MPADNFAGSQAGGAEAANDRQHPVPKPSLGPLVHIVYASRPFGFDDLALSGILATARRNNARDNITGALICREDLFLQWLEGPQAVVQALYGRIERDDRHTDLRCLISGPLAARVFPDWAMRHDPARSWMWTPEQVADGQIERAMPDEARAIFQRLADEGPDLSEATLRSQTLTACPMGFTSGGNGADRSNLDADFGSDNDNSSDA